MREHTQIHTKVYKLHNYPQGSSVQEDEIKENFTTFLFSWKTIAAIIIMLLLVCSVVFICFHYFHRLKNGVYHNGMVFKQSSTSYLSEKDLEKLENYVGEYSYEQLLHLSCNELYARNGMKFDNNFYADYYSKYKWYQDIPPANADYACMNVYEQYNLNLIVNFMKIHNFR